MMYNLRPKGESIISWLLKYGEKAGEVPPSRHIRDGAVAVVLYNPYEGAAPIARICYSALDFQKAKHNCSFINCRWWWVPIAQVKPFMGGQVIR